MCVCVLENMQIKLKLRFAAQHSVTRTGLRSANCELSSRRGLRVDKQIVFLHKLLLSIFVPRERVRETDPLRVVKCKKAAVKEAIESCVRSVRLRDFQKPKYR